MRVNYGCVYRMYDAQGALLYVGASAFVQWRLQDHRRSSHFWDDVTRIELQHFATREEALFHEAVAIRDEKPQINRHPGEIRRAENYFAGALKREQAKERA